MRRERRYANHATGTANGWTLEALGAACLERFSPPGYLVNRDDGSGTVWVSLEGGPLSIGLRPNAIDRRGLESVMADTDARLQCSAPDEAR